MFNIVSRLCSLLERRTLLSIKHSCIDNINSRMRLARLGCVKRVP